jgi:hypothetical protein
MLYRIATTFDAMNALESKPTSPAAPPITLRPSLFNQSGGNLVVLPTRIAAPPKFSLPRPPILSKSLLARDKAK